MQGADELAGDAQVCRDIARRAHTRPEDCYQCGKCAGGCPMAHHMDQLPYQLIRLVQLGRWEQAAGREAIWQCVSCQTCTARCPQQVDCAALLDALRQLSVERGLACESQRATWMFQQTFLQNVRRHGRLHETELVAVFKAGLFRHDWSLRGLFKDSLLGPRLMRRGKLHLRGQSVRDRAVVRRIFERCENGATRRGVSR